MADTLCILIVVLLLIMMGEMENFDGKPFIMNCNCRCKIEETAKPVNEPKEIDYEKEVRTLEQQIKKSGGKKSD